MRVVYRKANKAVLAAGVRVICGVTSDPGAIDIYSAYNGTTDASFIFADASAPEDLMSYSTTYQVDSAVSPTTVLKKYSIEVSPAAASLVADGNDSLIVTFTIKDSAGSTVTSGSYDLILKATNGFFPDPTVSTTSGVATATLKSGKYTGICVITAVDDAYEALAGGVSQVEILPSASIQGANDTAGIVKISDSVELVGSSAPSTPPADSSYLYKKTGNVNLFYKTDAGAEINLTSGAPGTGNVTGPALSTDHCLVQFDGTSGDAIQDATGVLFSSSGILDFAGISATGAFNLNSPSTITVINGSGPELTVSTSAVTCTTDSILTVSNSTISLDATSSSTGDIDIKVKAATGILRFISGSTTIAEILDDATSTQFDFTRGYLQFNAITAPATPSATKGRLYMKTGEKGIFWLDSDGTETDLSVAGSGDVTGPGSSTLNAVPRFSDTSGKILKNSTVVVADSGAVSGICSISHNALFSIVTSGVGAGIHLVSGSSSVLIGNTAYTEYFAIGGPGPPVIHSASHFVLYCNLMPGTTSTNTLGETSHNWLTVYTDAVTSGINPLAISTSDTLTVTSAAASFTADSFLFDSAAAIVLESTSVTTDATISPTTHNTVDLGTSTNNFRVTYSRLFDTKAGDSVTFNRGGSTYLVFQSANIENRRSIIPNTTNAYDLGDSTHVFKTIYASDIVGSDICITLKVSGALSVDTDLDFGASLPHAWTITGINVMIPETGSASSTIVDINLGSDAVAPTTIYTTQANRPEISNTDDDWTVLAATTPDITAVAANAFLTLDVDQAATGAEGVIVTIYGKRAS